MLRLDGQEGSDEMIQVFKEAQPQLQELSRNLKLRIKGLSTFGQRVLYAKAITDPDEAFWQFVRYVQGVPSIGTHFPFQFLTFLIFLSKKSNLQ